ncbi:MAG: DUF21 domain-containing protein [Planctomycetaceae bacterium]|nr:DUF21 domain-containing protein [Planctomycetaceae bacterium]MCB9950357.1 DUF21 domain-containing protein [Planctomycetaceae bacterium]
MTAVIDTLPQWLPGVLTMAVLVVASGFFSGSETALFYLSRDEQRRLQSGSSAERTAAELLSNPDRLLTAVLFWNLVINLAFFAVSLVTAKRLVSSGHASLAGVLSILSVSSLVLLGEVIPKSLAVSLRYPIAVLAGWPLSISVRILDPVIPVLGHISNAIQRVLWPRVTPEPYLQTEDLERAIETSELGVELAALEQEVLQRVIDLSEMTAEELMRPRNTLKLWEPPVHLTDLQTHLAAIDFLFLSDVDDETIVSAVSLDELSKLPEKNLETLAEKVIFVPWCSLLADVLAELRAKLCRVAVVVNEYGDTIGVVTESDILDTLLDPEASRARRLLRSEPIQPIGDHRIRVHGLTTLRYLARHLDIDFDVGDDNLLTVSGLLQELLGRFPQIGDECRWEQFTLKVVDAGILGREVRVDIDLVDHRPPHAD